MEIATAAELIFEARKDGLNITLGSNGRIVADGPRLVIDQYRERIKAAKPALLEYLRQCQTPPPGPRPAGDFTAAVATNTALGRPAAGARPSERQQNHIELHPTHRTTGPLLFHQSGKGPFVIETGTTVHVFPSLFAAKAVGGLPAEVWEGLGEWAFRKNQEKGYIVAWIAGDLRGVHPDHLEELDE
jgi:hypothetical protein